MRVAFVVQWFPPEPGTFVSSSIAHGLADRGHDVHVLTGFPNYPTGRLMEGYPLRPYRRDRLSENLTVHRAPLFPSHDRSGLRRAANYLSFAAAASWVSWHSLPRPDVWLTYSSPATAALPALVAPHRLRAPHVLLVQDLWPDSVVESGLVSGRPAALAATVLSRFCDWAYRRADVVATISPGMAALLEARGVPHDKLAHVPNTLDASHLRPDVRPTARLKKELGLPDGRLFMYAGNLGELQGLDLLIEAFAATPEATLVLVGDGVLAPHLRELAGRLAATNVHFTGPQPPDQVGAYVAASDIQVISLRDTPLLRATMPSKTQTALAAARPVLAHAAGDVATLVDTVACGASATPGDRARTVAAIRALNAATEEELDAQGRAGRRYYEENFSPGAGIDRLERLLVQTARRWSR